MALGVAWLLNLPPVYFMGPMLLGSLCRYYLPDAAVKVKNVLSKMALPAIIYALLMNVILLTYVYGIRLKLK